ncbi:MAG TPA: hypothetical protein VN673_10755, partial [Clostridia bacterium]|nr:hypothetical protein [Clostridia bacterium]
MLTIFFKKHRKRISAAALALICASFLAYWCSPALLTIDSGPCTAGAIVVLGGDEYGQRPYRAAEVFHEITATDSR